MITFELCKSVIFTFLYMFKRHGLAGIFFLVVTIIAIYNSFIEPLVKDNKKESDDSEKISQD